MELLYKDLQGNEIMNPKFVQWDQGQKIWLRGYTEETGYTTYLQFGNDMTNAVYQMETGVDTDGDLYADIPNAILQHATPINVYVYRLENSNDSLSAGSEDVSTPYGRTEYVGRLFVEQRKCPLSLVNETGMTLNEVAASYNSAVAEAESRLTSACASALSDISDAANNIETTISTAESRLTSAFSNALDGYQIRVSDTAPTVATNQKLITFVLF